MKTTLFALIALTLTTPAFAHGVERGGITFAPEAAGINETTRNKILSQLETRCDFSQAKNIFVKSAQEMSDRDSILGSLVYQLEIQITLPGRAQPEVILVNANEGPNGGADALEIYSIQSTVCQ